MNNIIDKDNIASVYLFYGEEAYKKRNYKERLKKLIAGDGNINYQYFEGKDIDLEALYDSAVTMPFFAEKKLIIIENSGRFKAAAKGSADGKREANAADASADALLSDQANTKETKRSSSKKAAGASDDMLERILNDIPKTTCLAFFETEVNKTKRIYKAIAAKGVVCECAADDKDALVLWLAKGFKAAGKNIRRSTAELIVDRVGTDYDRLRQEYEKIIAYAGESNEITDADVYAVTSEDIEAKIFELLDGVCMGDISKVLDRYHGLVANKEHPLYILAMLRTQFRTMLQVFDLAEMGYSVGAIASKLKKKDFVVRKSLNNRKYFSVSAVEKILDDISDTDMQIKSGYINEQIGLEMLLISITKGI